MTAQTDADVNGRPARAHVAGQTATQAVDCPRTSWQNSPPGWPSTGSNPSTAPTTTHYPRPAEERQVVRHKSFTPQGNTARGGL